MRKNGYQFVSVLALLIVALLPGLAVAEARFTPGDIYVSEDCRQFPPWHGDRIWRVDPDSGEAVIFVEFPLTPDCVGQYLDGLAFTPDGGKLRVSHYGAMAVYEFDADGNWTVVLDQSDGLVVPGLMQNLAYDRQGNFYVGDWWTARVWKFPADGGPGQVIMSPANGFFGPEGLAVAANGDLYVIDQSFPGKVFRRTPEGAVSLFDQYPMGNEDSAAIAADRDGYVYVHLDSTGRLLRYVAGHPETEEVFGSLGFGAEDEAMTLSSDGTHLILVSQAGVYRIDLTSGMFSFLTSVGGPEGVYTRGVASVPYDRGDVNFDAIVDVVDYAAFIECFEGPSIPSGGTACWAADLDADGDVDLRDYTQFELVLTNSTVDP